MHSDIAFTIPGPVGAEAKVQEVGCTGALCLGGGKNQQQEGEEKQTGAHSFKIVCKDIGVKGLKNR